MEGPGVAREKKFEKKFRICFAYDTPGHPLVSTKNFSQICRAVWPAKRNIYIYECLVLLYRLTIPDTSLRTITVLTPFELVLRL